MRVHDVQLAYKKMKLGDASGAKELLVIAKSEREGMSAAVALSFLFLNNAIEPEDYVDLAPFALYTLFMMCEIRKDDVAITQALTTINDSSCSWQLRCRAIWYLVSVYGAATPYIDYIERLRSEFNAGVNFHGNGHVPDLSFIDPEMAELQLIGLEYLT